MIKKLFASLFGKKEGKESGRITGAVKFYSRKKNYGFIKPDDNSEDLFVHRSGIEKGRIREGDKVSFVPAKGKKGRKAIKVRKVS